MLCRENVFWADSDPMQRVTTWIPHTSVDQDGEPYELTRFVLPADLSGLHYDVPVE